MTVAYLDTSALMKLLVDEPESAAMRSALPSWTAVGSVLVAIELATVARRRRLPDRARRVAELLRPMRTLGLTDAVVQAAGRPEQPPLRTLDLLHLLTARAARDALGLTTFVAYDRELCDAAAADGFEVLSPA